MHLRSASERLPLNRQTYSASNGHAALLSNFLPYVLLNKSRTDLFMGSIHEMDSPFSSVAFTLWISAREGGVGSGVRFSSADVGQIRIFAVALVELCQSAIIAAGKSANAEASSRHDSFFSSTPISLAAATFLGRNLGLFRI